jgi:hypothetical protein
MRDGICHFDTDRNYDARPVDIKDVARHEIADNKFKPGPK